MLTSSKLTASFSTSYMLTAFTATYSTSGRLGLSGSATASFTENSSYPTIANSVYWIDRFNSNTLTAGQSISSITLPSGWGAAYGSVTQGTPNRQPTYQTNGIQFDGSFEINDPFYMYMNLPLSYVSTSDFTMYFVLDRPSNTNCHAMPLGGNQSLAGPAYGDVLLGLWPSSDAYTGGGTAYTGWTDATQGKTIRKIRRTSGSLYYKTYGAVEQSGGTNSSTIQVDLLGARIGQYPAGTRSTVRLCQVVLVNRSIPLNDADEVAIINKLQTLESGASW